MKAVSAFIFLNFFIAGFLFAGPFEDALKLYKEGSYRRSIEALTGSAPAAPSGVRSPLEYYLLGRDYYEMKDYQSAGDEFSNIGSPAVFNSYPEGSFFRENYIYYYSLVLYEIGREGIIKNLFRELDPGSVYYEDVLKTWLFYEWKAGRLDIILKTGQTNSCARMYRAFASFVKGNHDSFGDLFDFIDERDYNTLFSGITNYITDKDMDSIPREKGAQALNVFYKFKMTDRAAYLIDRLASAAGDPELIFRSRLILLCKKGDYDGALNFFNKRFDKADCPAPEIEYFSQVLLDCGRMGEAYNLLKKGVEKYPGDLASEWIKVLDRQHRDDELYSWAMPLIPGGAINANNGGKIFRILLGSNKESARKIAAEMLKSNGYDAYFLYVNALLDLEGGNKEAAYSKFLKTSLYHPYTYEGIISANYEKQFHNTYTNIYSLENAEFLNSNINMSMQDRLCALTASGRPEFRTEKDRLEGNFRDVISKAFSDNTFTGIIPMKWFSFVNRGLLSYNHEIFNILDRRLPDPVSRFKASYNYADFYRALDLEGVVLSRLNLYITRICGGREYHPVLEDNLRKNLYPLLYFDDVMTFSRDTNEGLWALSAFREESHFNKNSISQAGAAGLAQLMPATADIIKKNMKKEDYSCYDFRDNLEIGAFHINYLFKKYHHNYIYALAAYNAGETAVNRWKRRSSFENELWVEAIDYEETREYIRKIFQTRYFYSLFYGFDFEAAPALTN
jgi:hypothetical protein